MNRTITPDELPDTVTVKLRDGRIVLGIVTGKSLRWPTVYLPDTGASAGEVAPETLVHLAETGRPLLI
jgi:hypothetical protein